MPASNGSPFTFDAQSGRCRIKARDGSLPYFYRAVMEGQLGRHLRADEHVHHINGDTGDDRPENLTVLNTREHGALHGRETWKARKAKWMSPWSEHYSWCMVCHTTERPHVGHGLCSRCNARIKGRARRFRERVAWA